MKRSIAGLLLFLGLASPALAQQVVNPLPNAGVYGAYNAVAPTCVTGTGCWIQTDINGNLKVSNTPSGTQTVVLSSQYPLGATAITASATGTTGATAATLAGVSAKTTYICSYSIRANATAATTVTNTVAGVITATMTHVMWIAPLASGLGVDEQIYNPCVPASTTNTGIVVTSGAPGSAGTVSVTATGYQL